MLKVLGMALIFFLLQPSLGSANDGPQDASGFAGTLGVSWGYGQLGSNDMGLKDRAMSAASLEALAGYRLNSRWIIGGDLNCRFQSQLASLSDADGTNLKGRAWLIGLGAQYQIDEKWRLQTAVEFLGRYDFDKPTSNAEDDHLAAPLGFRAKAQHLFRDQWSLDAGLSYTRWSTFHVGGTDNSKLSSQWMIEVGLSYHFGTTSPTQSTNENEKESRP
ncbi:MAG: hypothetical protein KF681_04905 [Bdellovibrionaceae bacterium]|nr:hypothetical protein [Pseudobdellovibrionaceae bacterium]